MKPSRMRWLAAVAAVIAGMPFLVHSAAAQESAPTDGLHLIYEHADVPGTDHPGHVDQSSDEFFTYTHEYLEKNFTYTYTDETGVHTVPITTPATTEPMMRALVKEVWTNRAIPGRRWVREIEPGRSHYVSYVVEPGDPRQQLLGITPGDYTPYVDGLTALLIEGKDEDVAGYTESDLQGHMLFNRLKSISLITNRTYISDNNFTAEGENSLNSGPGYIFSFQKQLRKFFVATKGKARNLVTHPDFTAKPEALYNYVPMPLMFEEFSPNEATDRNPQNVYGLLMSGDHMFVTHDCSSALTNAHWMRMIAPASNAPVDINLSIFIPDFRNYDDYDRHELYTWYDPEHQPFFYRYTISLAATPFKADPEGLKQMEAEGLIEVPDNDSHSDKYDHCYWVKLDWSTNFRRELFNTVHNGEFMMYRVVDGVMQTTPIVTLKADIDGSVVKTDSDGNVILTVSPDGKLTGNAYIGTIVYLLEPQEVMGHDVYYVCAGRPEGMREAGYTTSNVAKAHIPGYNLTERLILDITSSERSAFNVGEPMNHYTNELHMLNRHDLFGISALDLMGTDKEAYGEGDPVFTLWRQPETASASGQFVPDKACKVSTITIDRTLESSNCYFTGRVDHFNPDGTVDTDKKVRYQYDREEVNTVRWRALGSLADNGRIENLYAAPGNEALITWIDEFDAHIPNDNSHPERYTYFVEYTRGDRKLNSNIENVAVYKAEISVEPTTYSLADIYADTDRRLKTSAYDVNLKLLNSPMVDTYRVRYPENFSTFAMLNDDLESLLSEDILAEVRVKEDRFSVSRRSTEAYRQLIVDKDGNQQYVTTTILEPVGEPVAVGPGENREISICLQGEQVFEEDGTARPLVVQTSAIPSHVTTSENVILNTYGSNYAKAAGMPQVHIMAEMQGVIGQPHLNRMSDGIVYTTWDNVTDYDVIGVDHYKMWYEPSYDDEALVHDHTRTMPYHDSTQFANAWYTSADNSVMQFTQGHFDPAADAMTSCKITVRAYIAVRPKQPVKPGRVHILAEQPITYLVAETSANITYNPDRITTGVEGLPSADNGPLYVSGTDCPVIHGQGPLQIHALSGALVRAINDSATERTVEGLAPGVYIVSSPTATVKFVVK